MDLRLPITTINGEPIEYVGPALLALGDSLGDHLRALERGEPFGRLVLPPCVLRALAPIWIELRLADGPDPPELSPDTFLVTYLIAVERLFEQWSEAVDHNWSSRCAT